MFRVSHALALCSFVGLTSLLAAPKLEFDKTTFDCGTVIEGKTDKLQATFIAKNSGNTPLKIINVRPGCGCTVVKFDTSIAPGKTGKIDASVNIANYHAGSISKSITVTSDDTTKATTVLTISANVSTVIDISETSLSLECSKTSLPHTITLSTAKKDLKIKSIQFTENEAKGSEWQKQIPITITYALSTKDSVRADGFKIYKLELIAPVITSEQLYGKLIIKTNHADKSEIMIPCNLVKK